MNRIMTEDENIKMEAKELVRQYISRPLSASIADSEFKRALDEQLRGGKEWRSRDAGNYIKGQRFGAVVELLASIARWHPANPNRKLIVDRLNETYATPRTANSTVNLNYADAFLYALKTEQLIAIVGNRGSGKTTFTNHWLNNNTKTILEQELRMAWFRIDAHKIYNMWFGDNAIGRTVSLIEYFKVHAVYVMLVYGGKIPRLLRDGDTISEQFVAIMRWYRDEGYEECTTPTLHEIINKIDIEYGRFNSKMDFSDIFIKEILCSKLYKLTFCEIYDVLQDRLLDNNIGLLCMLDGLDNISWSRRNTEYFRMCMQVGELRDFVLTRGSGHAESKTRFVITIRPETIPDIPSFDLYYHEGGVRVDAFRGIAIELPSLQSILDIKCRALQQSKNFDAERAKCRSAAEHDGHEPEKYLNETINDINNYASQYVDSLNRSIQLIVISASKRRGSRSYFYNGWEASGANFVETMLNGNCRAFVDGFLEVLRLIQAAKDIGISGSTNNSRLWQYLLLNGRLFVDSKQYENRINFRRKIRRGEYFPNLFWFNTQLSKGPHGVWHGMVTLRILQLCNSREFMGEEIITLLNALFGYEKACIEDRIESMIAFGLITSIRTEQASNRFSKCDVRPEWRIELSVSDRGKMLFDLLFAYPDWLYFMALDTPLPGGLSSSSNHVRVFVDPDSKEFIHNFLDAYCVTVPTMARIIKHYEIAENMKIAELLNSEEYTLREVKAGIKDVYLYNKTIIGTFALPQNWEAPFIRGVQEAAYGRWRSDKSAGRTLVMDMRGAFEEVTRRALPT